jgi:tRNA (mo5U34)-methyltransferase
VDHPVIPRRKPGLPTSQDDPRLAGWYHTIELGGGLVSKGVFDLRPVAGCYGLPRSLEGKEVLDIGTGDGFFAFEMEERGADRVVAVDLARLGDVDWVPHMKTRIAEGADITTWPDHFRMARDLRGSRVEYRNANVYELSPYTIGTFDVVFCGSLLLHLQNPLGALHAIRSITRELAIIETAVLAELEEQFPGRPYLAFGYPGEEEHPGERTSYWTMTSAALEKMLRYAGFDPVEHQGTFLLPPAGPLASAFVARPKP